MGGGGKVRVWKLQNKIWGKWLGDNEKWGNYEKLLKSM